MKNLPPHNLGYVPSLDGLRAIAVLVVMLVHANFQFGLNGGLGVSVFFALSGFLITTLLLEEFRKNNHISFKGFYIRRTMRLFPPLYVMLICIFIYAHFFREGLEQKNIYQDIISAGLYVYNIAYCWGWSTKFILLYHTWSLGVEEQFYLLWPLILFFGIKKNMLGKLQLAVLFFILGTVLLKSIGSFPLLAGSIIKESIFIGCLAALARWTGLIYKVPSAVATISFFIILILGTIPLKLPHYDLLFNVCGVLSSLIILHLAYTKESFISRTLSNNTMVFVGKISYSLYLWHLPIFKIFSYHSTLPPLISFIAKLVVSFGMAILSWYTIEKAATAFGRKASKKITDTLKEKTVYNIS